MTAPAEGPRYRVLRELGRGSSAVVYEASDLARGTSVALKALLPGASSAARERLLREHAVLSGWTHPHVVRTHGLADAAVVDATALPVEGRPTGTVLVLERLGGPTLAEARLRLDDRLSAWAQVAHGLDALHLRGFVHRDLKPSNVLLRATPSPDRPVEAVVADLGDAVGATESATLGAGTLDYVAPEALGGAPPRPTADVYSLGALLFHLATGAPPWSSLGPEESLHARQRATPHLPEGIALPRGMESVLERLMAPDPARRPPTALAAIRLLNEATGSRHPDTVGGLAVRPSSSPLVGRADVLSAIERFVDAAGSETAPRIAWLTGEPGSGRSRLLEEVEVLVRLRGLPVAREPRAGLGADAVVLLDAGAAAGLGETFAPPVGTWLVCAPPGTPAPAGALELRLAPLDDSACLEMACALLGAPLVSGGDGAMLRAATAGLPGRLEQLVTALAEAGSLRLDESLRLRVDPGSPVLRQELAQALTSRLAHLSPRAVVLIERGAVLGRPTPVRLLAALGGMPVDAPETAELLALCVQHGFLAPSIETEQGATFEVPEPVRHAVLHGVAAPRLVMLRVATAALLSREVPGSEGEQAALLDAAGARERAAPLHRQAGERALAGGSPLAAARHLRRALESGAWDGAARGELLVASAKALALGGDARASLRAVEEALPMLSSEAARAEALALAAEAASHVGAAEAAEAACRHARRLFRRLGSLGGRAECTNRLGLLAAIRGDLRRARAAFRAALAVARTRGDRALEARVLNNLGDASRRAGDLDAAASAHVRARDIRLSIGDARGAAKATNNLGIIHGIAGRAAEAAEDFAAAAAAFQKVGDRLEEARCRNNRGLALWHAGKLADADEELRRAAELFAALGEPLLLADAEANRGLAASDGGRLVDAANLLRAAAGRCAGDADRAASITLDLADVQRAMGDGAGALASRRRALELAPASTPLRILAEDGLRTDLALAGSASKEGRAHVDAPVPGDWPDEMAARVLLERALLAEQLGDVPTARARAAQALSRLPAEDRSSRERIEAALLAAGPAPGPEEVALLEKALAEAPPEAHAEAASRARLRMALGHLASGRADAAASQIERARAQLEELAGALSPEARAGFWSARHRAEDLSTAESKLAAARARAPAASAASAPLPVLLELVRLLSANLDVAELLPRIVDFAIELSGADRGCLILFDDQPDLIRIARSRDGQDLPRDRFQHSQTILEKVRSTGKPVVIDSFAADESAPRSASIHELRLGSATCVPLPAPPGVGGGLLGAIYVDSLSRGSGFGQREVDALGAIAAHAAIAIVNAQLLARVRAEKETLQTEVERLRRGWAEEEAFGEALGHSPAMREVFTLLSRVAPTDVSILIEGESGTGKEVVARAIHAQSRRASGPFVAVDCGGLPESLIESELFGHRRGAFTGAERDRPGLFEQASGGTIFLDEVAGTPPALQAKLLRVLQEREVRRVGENQARPIDVRVVAASNRFLAGEVSAGRFREDLFFRINVVTVRLPPLRERPEDVPLLARHFLERVVRREGLRIEGWAPGALPLLARHAWQGNVRELQNVVERAAVMAAGPLVVVDDLPAAIVGRSPRLAPATAPASSPANVPDHQPPTPPRVEKGVPLPAAAGEATVAATRAAAGGSHDLWALLVEQGGDFWVLVRDAYARHEVTRADVRSLVSQALLRTGGSYRQATALLGVQPADYKRFMDFLRQNGCRLDFRPFRQARKAASAADGS